KVRWYGEEVREHRSRHGSLRCQEEKEEKVRWYGEEVREHRSRHGSLRCQEEKEEKVRREEVRDLLSHRGLIHRSSAISALTTDGRACTPGRLLCRSGITRQPVALKDIDPALRNIEQRCGSRLRDAEIGDEPARGAAVRNGDRV